MKLRRPALVALLSSLVALAPPTAAAPAAAAPAAAAPAEDLCLIARLNVGLAGAVSVTCVTDDLYVITGDCAYAAVLTPNNRLTVAFGGVAAAVGPQLPQLTYIFCEVYNNVGDRDFCEFASGGAISFCVKATRPWRVAPITICVYAFAVFGPTPIRIVNIPYTCAYPLSADERPGNDEPDGAPADLVQRVS